LYCALISDIKFLLQSLYIFIDCQDQVFFDLGETLEKAFK